MILSNKNDTTERTNLYDYTWSSKIDITGLSGENSLHHLSWKLQFPLSLLSQPRPCSNPFQYESHFGGYSLCISKKTAGAFRWCLYYRRRTTASWGSAPPTLFHSGSWFFHQIGYQWQLSRSFGKICALGTFGLCRHGYKKFHPSVPKNHRLYIH